MYRPILDAVEPTLCESLPSCTTLRSTNSQIASIRDGKQDRWLKHLQCSMWRRFCYQGLCDSRNESHTLCMLGGGINKRSILRPAPTQHLQRY